MLLPHVVTVILNTNRREDTLACLGSLQRGDYPNHEIILLDNSSRDGSVEAIRTAFPEVHIIELSENRGYAGNNNVGIAAALQRGADWVLVLNEDMAVAADAISQMIQVAVARQDIGVIGPMVYHFDEPTVIQSAGGVLDWRWLACHSGQNETDRGQFAQSRTVDWVSGCAIMVRRQTIEQIGALDERFFYYWEEIDWCLRARQNGWLIEFVPQARVWHKGVSRHYRPSPSVTYYATRNWFLLLAKQHAPLSARIYAWLSTLRTLLSWTLKPRWRSQRAHRNAMWHGAADFLRGRWGPMPQYTT